MKLNDWLHQAIQRLEQEGISTARLDCLVLLADALKKDKSYLLAHPELDFQGRTLETLDKQVEKRAQHVPLAYIRGKSEFYGREFAVTPDTLEPRPETETIIELLKHEDTTNKAITDVGTGSGCLAITAQKEFPTATVYATDISDVCLSVARQNAAAFKADVTFYEGNLLTPVGQEVDIVITNLPYVPDDYSINLAASHEPRLAIFGGPDGLDLYRELFGQITALADKPKLVLTECLPFQHTELTQIATAAGYSLKTSEDFIQVFTKN